MLTHICLTTNNNCFGTNIEIVAVNGKHILLLLIQGSKTEKKLILAGNQPKDKKQYKKTIQNFKRNDEIFFNVLDLKMCQIFTSLLVTKQYSIFTQM